MSTTNFRKGEHPKQKLIPSTTSVRAIIKSFSEESVVDKVNSEKQMSSKVQQTLAKMTDAVSDVMGLKKDKDKEKDKNNSADGSNSEWGGDDNSVFENTVSQMTEAETEGMETDTNNKRKKPTTDSSGSSTPDKKESKRTNIEDEMSLGIELMEKLTKVMNKSLRLRTSRQLTRTSRGDWRKR